MTVYMRQDALGNRQMVTEDDYLLACSNGRTPLIIINTKDLCVYRPRVSPNMVAHQERLKYGGRGRGYKSPVGYGGY